MLVHQRVKPPAIKNVLLENADDFLSYKPSFLFEDFHKKSPCVMTPEGINQDSINVISK